MSEDRKVIGYDLGDAASEPAVVCSELLPGGKIHIHWAIKGREAREWLAANVPTGDLDPPSYLPMREQPPPRIPDLCPDDSRDEPQIFNAKPIEPPPGYWSTKDPTVFHETTLREIGIDLRGTEFRVAPTEPHNPETCRDPACDCYPF